MQRSSKSGETSLARYDIIVKTFWGLPSWFLVWIENFSSQHQTSTTLSGTCGRNRSTPALPRSPLCVPTSTPKPRAASSNLTAPANPLVPRLCENRMAWGFFVPMLPWTGSSFSLPMPYMFPSCAISSHRLSKIQHQNRTPSFRFCVSAPRAAHLRLAMLYASRKIFLFFVYSTAIFEVGGACLFAEKKEVILPLCAAFSPPTGYSSDSSGNCPKIAATPVLTHRRMALRWEKMASVTP